ncbi:MAG: glycerol kinase GlpK [Clostridia bacterium]|nr:glycerol kinase GlpK [Clostridia bacterium]
MAKYLLALDAGTTSSRAIIFDLNGKIISMDQLEFPQIFPCEGYVEHNPDDIWNTQITVAQNAIKKAGLAHSDICAIGITNQRETTIIWDKTTGKPIYNAIVWQCRRTSDYCDELRRLGLTDMIREKTGLVLDPYFSATKIKWILDHVEGARDRAKNGELCFGTVDSWLIYNLTGKKVHATDYSNASRTMLYNINDLEWDKTLLEVFDIPASILPEVMPSSGIFGYTAPELFGGSIPVAGVAGDQQAALFGQCCYNPGDAKNTYGTGGFLLMNTGEKPVFSKNGLVTTIAWGLNGKVYYALEGSVFICGAAVQWLRDGLGLVNRAAETEEIASTVADSGGVYFVPAFVGLGAPYWDPYARGSISGLTRGTTRAHIVRAVLDSMAFQTYDVLALMQSESGITFDALNVDGGASANNLLLKIQADLLGKKVLRPSCIETTALGAAYLAGLGVGAISSTNSIISNRSIDTVVDSDMDILKRMSLINDWHKAVDRSRGWVNN